MSDIGIVRRRTVISPSQGMAFKPAASVATGTGDLATGLVAYWPINDAGGSGTSLADSVNSNTATIDSSGQWNGGGDLFQNGANSLLFGGNHWAQAPDISAYAWGTHLSVVMWLHAVQDDGQGDVSHVFTQWDWTGTLGNSFMMRHPNNGPAMDVFLYQSGTKRDYTGSQTCFDGTWHSVGFRFRGDTGVLDLFVDGVKDPSPTKTIDLSMTAVDDATCPIFMASLSDGSGNVANSAFFKTLHGALRNVRMYNTLKSDALFSNFHSNGIE